MESGAENAESGDEFRAAHVGIFEMGVEFAEDAGLSESDSGHGEFGGAVKSGNGRGFGGEFISFDKSGVGGFGCFWEFGDFSFCDSGSEEHGGAVEEEGFDGSVRVDHGFKIPV